MSSAYGFQNFDTMFPSNAGASRKLADRFETGTIYTLEDLKLHSETKGAVLNIQDE